jgi:putative transposase
MHAFLPKVTQKEDYPEVEHPWISFGVMRTLVCDNGPEFHSEALDDACHRLGINLEYAPRKTGWYKGKIERFLRTLNEEVAHGTLGTTYSNIFERGDYNPEKYAVIRLSTLKLGLQMWVCDVYHQRKHHALDMPPEIMWRLHARTEDIRIPGDRNALHIVMGRPYSRVLTHKGIEFVGLYYGSEATHELRIRYGAELKVEIRVNEENIGEIHVLYGQEVVTARALKFDYANGISLWLHEQIKKHSPKYDPDVWLVGKERLRRLFRNEPDVLRKSPKRGMGRVSEQLGPKELSRAKQVPQLPAPPVTLEATDFISASGMNEIPDIPQYAVIVNRGGSRGD